ncbi:hypothetical protein ACD591_07295 [Rufibacter glacialis]|uniref:DUF4468 domain-containing protein n=1 Tax=Rufibacter glacialis TaxID=1259555 RepID=A0A5M8QGC5_9BACT|nr:hypothetical protein [Rufibacter glacialis]KAA6433452.1 hypothetical protein FOE74_13350 [Rufibacter glacialis]GGK74083.1 hypothetical protein GCM10011405_22680 [Rufibacter glacialis]
MIKRATSSLLLLVFSLLPLLPSQAQNHLQAQTQKENIQDLINQLVTALTDQGAVGIYNTVYRVGYIEVDQCLLTYQVTENLRRTHVVSSKIYKVNLAGLTVDVQAERSLSLSNDLYPATVTVMRQAAPYQIQKLSLSDFQVGVTDPGYQELNHTFESTSAFFPLNKNTSQIRDLLLRLSSACQQ